MMKTFLTAIALVSSLSVFAQQAQMEAGRYVGTDIESGTIEADLTLKADKTLVFQLRSEDFEIPEPGCTGSYTQQNNFLFSDVNCPIDFFPTASVKLDITNVNYDSVRSAGGAVVYVYVDALGDEPIAFKMKIVE